MPCFGAVPAIRRRAGPRLRALGLWGGLLWALACPAAQVEGLTVEDVVPVGGQRLPLQGAGVSRSWMVRVYAIALYAPAGAESLAALQAQGGPRRLAITLLRDVSAREFREAITDQLAQARPGPDRQALDTVARHLVQAVAARGTGLAAGDRLTFDWVPGTGTVVELNQRPLIEPVRGNAFQEALLAVWLGEQASDTPLRAALLGQRPGRLTALR